MFSYNVKFSVQCPKCKAKIRWRKVPMSTHRHTCHNCGLEFKVQINVSTEEVLRVQDKTTERRHKAASKNL